MTDKRFIARIYTKSFDKSKRKNGIIRNNPKLENAQIVYNRKEKWIFCGIFIHRILHSNEKEQISATYNNKDASLKQSWTTSAKHKRIVSVMVNLGKDQE